MQINFRCDGGKMKILKKSTLVAVFALGLGCIGFGSSFVACRTTNRADGGAPPPPPLPVPKAESMLIADGGAPPPPPIPWAIV